MRTVYNTALFEEDVCEKVVVSMRRDGIMVDDYSVRERHKWRRESSKSLYAQDIRAHNVKLAEMGLL